MDKHILLVDDEESILVSLTWLLKREGYLVTSTTSGNKAYALLKHKCFDFILSDLMMSDGSGAELAQKLKINNLSTPLFFMTGSDVDQFELMAHGAAGVFRKPFEIEAIIETLRKF